VQAEAQVLPQLSSVLRNSSAMTGPDSAILTSNCQSSSTAADDVTVVVGDMVFS
jgi:hypothetical protein